MARSADEDARLFVDPELIARHFGQDWNDTRKYLVDWLLLVRALRNRSLKPATSRKISAMLRSLGRKGNKSQRFYSGLILGKRPPEVSQEDLAVGRIVYSVLRGFAQLSPRPPAMPG